MLPLPPELLMLREAKHFDPNVCPPLSLPKKFIWSGPSRIKVAQCSAMGSSPLFWFTSLFILIFNLLLCLFEILPTSCGIITYQGVNVMFINQWSCLSSPPAWPDPGSCGALFFPNDSRANNHDCCHVKHHLWFWLGCAMFQNAQHMSISSDCGNMLLFH